MLFVVLSWTVSLVAAQLLIAVGSATDEICHTKACLSWRFRSNWAGRLQEPSMTHDLHARPYMQSRSLSLAASLRDAIAEDSSRHHWPLVRGLMAISEVGGD